MSLPPHITDLLGKLLSGSGLIRIQDLVRLILAMVAAGLSTDMIANVLMQLMLAGKTTAKVALDALGRAGVTTAVADAAAGGAAAGGAATGGSAAGGTTAGGGAAAAGAVFVAAVAVALAAWRIKDEADTRIAFPDGVPCPCVSGCGKKLTVEASRPGSRWATNIAKSRALRKNAELVTCATTPCEESGKVCAPIPTFIDVDPKYRVLWTTTVITYQTGCKCISIVDLLGAG